MDQFEVFLASISNPSFNPEEASRLSKIVISEYENNKDKLSFDIQKIGSSVSTWVKNNFSSKLLSFPLVLLINLYERLGFMIDFDLHDYYKTSDKLDEKDPKALEKADLEGFENDKDVLIENPLFSSEVIQVALSLIENLVSKRMHMSHKNMLILILPIISIYSTDKKVQSIIRKKKFLKMILKIFKDIVETNPTLTETDIKICSYLLHTTAKLSFHNKKNQDYLIKKKGYEYIKGVIATSQDLSLLKGAISTFANLCETTDGRLVLWCSGSLPFINQRIKVALHNIRKYLDVNKRKTSSFKHALQDLELCLIALWKLSSGSDEVIEECLKTKDLVKAFEEVLELMEVITPSDPQYLYYVKCVGVDVAILRRFCSSEEFRKETIERYGKYFYKVPRVYAQEIEQAKDSHSFLLKELAGLVGTICLDREQSQGLVNSDIVGDMLKIGIAFFDSPKLLKTVIGFFINVNANDEIRENLSKNKDIYILLYNILDKYDYLNLIIDYTLKLIINTCHTDLFFRNYVSPQFLDKFLWIFHIYLEDDPINASMIKLFRILTSKLKSLEIFASSVREYEAKMDNKYDFISALVENSRVDDYQLTIDVIMLISTLAENNETFKESIQSNNMITSFIKAFLNCYKDKPEVLKMVTTSLAYLPLEQLGSFL